MKKIIVLLLIAMMLCLTACSSQNNETSAAGQEPAAGKDPSDVHVTDLSQNRIDSISTIKKISDNDGLNVYSIDISYDYDIDDLIAPPGSYDTQDIIDRYVDEAVPGMKLNISMPDYGCSAFIMEAADGNVYMGRNYDFAYDTSALQVRCHPEDGYESVGYCALNDLKVQDPRDSERSKIATLVSPFICLDGMNEKGVAIAVLTLPTEPTAQNTGKKVLDSSIVIRLVLDKAATTQEAVDLISQYDMFCICNRDYHFYITDASGDGRIVEFDPEREGRPTVVTPIRIITNYFGMYEDSIEKGDRQEYTTKTSILRRDNIEKTIESAGAGSDRHTVMEALRASASEPDPDSPDSIVSNTQWSIVYNMTDLSHDFVLHRNWDDIFSFESLSAGGGSTEQTG